MTKPKKQIKMIEDMKNKIYCGDSLDVLKTFPNESVDCVITSPPYWGLRDYGVSGQLGLEKTPEEYVSKMVEVFREVKRVLKKEGTLWLNLGDTYSAARWSSGKGQPMNGGKDIHRTGKETEERQSLLPDKNLVGIPWRTAFALQNDGWILRQDIIWHKPNPIPESVTDRCTKSHEYVFLLSKSPKYYFNNEAIKEDAEHPESIHVHKLGNKMEKVKNNRLYATKPQRTMGGYMKRNKRSVWTITTKPFRDAHFATFPEDLIIPMIKTTRKDATILDPFMGAGTTGVVCKKLGRNYVGIELNPKYVEMAEKRINSISKKLL